jgi:chromosomal replication initiator protein
LFLLDDLEQLLDKPAAQMELRLLLDSFAAEDGIVVMTSQTLPCELPTGKAEPLLADLAVRIQGGTTIPLFPPGEAVRRRFIYDVASALRIPFTESALNTAAKELTGTIPQLYGTIVQKYVEAKAANVPLEPSFWQQFSKRQSSTDTQSLTDIAKRTATYFSLKLVDLKGEKRHKTIALARSIAVYLARTQLRLTFKEIGRFFGKRDPSTVRHLFDSVQSNLRTDPVLRDHLFRLTIYDRSSHHFR